MFGQNREQMRAVFIEAWHQHCAGLPMQQLQLAVAAVITEHPEYHALMGNEEKALSQDFSPDGGSSNPFLHMAMHLSLREQIGTNRPPGIATVYQQLCGQAATGHDAEHLMLDVLGQHLWQSSRSGLPPDDASYIRDLKNLLTK